MKKLKSIKGMMKTFGDWCRRFVSWQENGRPIKDMKMEETTCKHCGTTFKGNYCPRCGQSRTVSMITKRGFVSAFMEAYPQLAMAFLHTMQELVFRPGYMIRDFFCGHRIIYSGPFKTFIIMGSIFVIFTKIGGIDKSEAIQTQTELETRLDNYIKIHQPEKSQTNSDKLENKFNKLDKELDARHGIAPVWQLVKKKMNDENTLNLLLAFPVFALASKLTFRKRLFDGRRLIYAEHFMVFVYLAALELLISVAAYVLHICMGKPLTTDYPILLLPFYVVWTFKALYGMGWWATIRRMLVFCCWGLLFALIEFIVLSFAAILFFLSL